MPRENRKGPENVVDLGDLTQVARKAELSENKGLTPLESARAVLEAGRALRMPAGDVAAAIGKVVKEIKPVPPLNS